MANLPPAPFVAPPPSNQVSAPGNNNPTPYWAQHVWPNGPTPPPAAPAPAPAPNPGSAQTFTSAEQDAWAILLQTLQGYGFTGQDLTSLGNFVKQELINGTGSDQITLDLEQTPEFAKRFPAIVARRDQGLPAISPAEYVSLERSYSQLERAAGIPPNFTDQSHYDQLIANDVSPSEYADRINKGYAVVAQGDPTVQQAFQDYYGITPGHLAAYF